MFKNLFLEDSLVFERIFKGLDNILRLWVIAVNNNRPLLYRDELVQVSNFFVDYETLRRDLVFQNLETHVRENLRFQTVWNTSWRCSKADASAITNKLIKGLGIMKHQGVTFIKNKQILRLWCKVKSNLVLYLGLKVVELPELLEDLLISIQ